jgi:hypothetical protein
MEVIGSTGSWGSCALIERRTGSIGMANRRSTCIASLPAERRMELMRSHVPVDRVPA